VYSKPYKIVIYKIMTTTDDIANNTGKVRYELCQGKPMILEEISHYAKDTRRISCRNRQKRHRRKR